MLAYVNLESSDTAASLYTSAYTASVLADVSFELARIATTIKIDGPCSSSTKEKIETFAQSIRNTVPADSYYKAVHEACGTLTVLVSKEYPESDHSALQNKISTCIKWLSLAIEYSLQFTRNSFVGKLPESFWETSLYRCRQKINDPEIFDASYCAPQELSNQESVTEYELQTPIRLLGAELEFLFHRLAKYQAEPSKNDSIIDALEIPRFCNHLGCFISDLRQGFNSKERTPYSVATITGLSLIGTLTQQLEAGIIGAEEYKTSVWNVYQELTQVTILRGYPERCRELELTLLEFNTDFSGLPDFLIPVVQSLDRGVLIDTSLKIQQDGLGREMLTSEAEKLLRSAGARLFVIKSGDIPIGYDMFLPKAQEGLLPGVNLINDLVEKGILEAERTSNIGFLRSVVVPPGKRLAFAKAGVNAYDLLDDLMGQVASFENCDSMVCTVRVGDNPNVSRKAHERRRWKATGYIIRDIIPGAAPLEVFVRDPRDTVLLPKDFFPADKTPPLGFRPHFNPYRPDEVDFTQYEIARCISDKEATDRVIDEFALRYKVYSYYGSLQRYITVNTSSILFNLHQLRPGFDYWYLTSNGSTGTLEECIEHIRNDLHYSSKRSSWRNYD